MAASGVFATTRFTALASGDIIPVVDVSNTTQNAHGSLLSITVANFFKLVPVAPTFGLNAVPVALAAHFPNGNVVGVTPDVATAVIRSGVVLCTGYDQAPAFIGAQAGGTVAAPAAVIATESLVQLVGMGYDAVDWYTSAVVSATVIETAFAAGAHGTELQFRTTAIGATTLVTSLKLRNVANATQLIPAATSLSFRNSANNADNLIILDAGGATFRSTVSTTGITLSGTSAKIIASATSLLIRDAADANTNVTLTDAGAMTVRSVVTASAGLVINGAGSFVAGVIDKDVSDGFRVSTITGAANDLNIYRPGSATSVLSVPTGTANLVFGGSIKTSTPVGGTAAAWKLGTVAVVSPTSPNRTIEIDVGGTIYYLAAKTTNN